MPMNFPTHESIIQAAEIHKFRKPTDAETEQEYRKALAAHVKPIDFIESFEILFGTGWDQWTKAQKQQTMRNL